MHHQHRSRHTALGGVAVALALAAGGAPAPAAAEEAGQSFGRAVLVVTSRKAARIEDRANHTASLSEMDGVVFNGDGKPFLDKARYQVVDLIRRRGVDGRLQDLHGRGRLQGLRPVRGDRAGRPEARGTFEFTGGTGRYRASPGAASSASRGSATPRPGTSFAATPHPDRRGGHGVGRDAADHRRGRGRPQQVVSGFAQRDGADHSEHRRGRKGTGASPPSSAPTRAVGAQARLRDLCPTWPSRARPGRRRATLTSSPSVSTGCRPLGTTSGRRTDRRRRGTHPDASGGSKEAFLAGGGGVREAVREAGQTGGVAAAPRLLPPVLRGHRDVRSRVLSALDFFWA